MLIGKKKHYDFKIDDINIYTLLERRDFKLTQDQRLDLVDYLLYEEDGNLISYLEHFFDDTKNNGVSIFCPSSIQPLSSDINVCNGLETLANYILYSPDGERLTEKIEYNFYTDKKDFKKRMTELSLNHFEDMDETIDFLEDTCRNYLLETNQKVYSHDLKKFPVLKEYNVAIDRCIDLLKNDMDQKSKYKIGQCISDLRKNQADLKSSLAGTIIFKHISTIGEKFGEPDVNGFDFEAVKKMFLSANMKQMTPFGELGYVFLDILDKIEKNEAENVVLSMFIGENKANYAEIARKMNVSSNFIHQTVGKLRNKIIKEYMKRYEDWYYTFEDYGWYKKCSVCGETKLLSITYFQKNSSSNDGFRAVCKLCT